MAGGGREAPATAGQETGATGSWRRCRQLAALPGVAGVTGNRRRSLAVAGVRAAGGGYCCPGTGEGSGRRLRRVGWPAGFVPWSEAASSDSVYFGALT